MRISLANIKEKVRPTAAGMALLLLGIVSFIVAMWVLMAIVRVIVPAA